MSEAPGAVNADERAAMPPEVVVTRHRLKQKQRDCMTVEKEKAKEASERKEHETALAAGSETRDLEGNADYSAGEDHDRSAKQWHCP